MSITLSITPLVGWRMWTIICPHDLSRVHLAPYATSFKTKAWALPQKAVAAKCYRRHKCPDKGCTCGYYAYNSFVHLEEHVVKVFGKSMRKIIAHPIALGKIKAWGKIIVHARGFKSEFACPIGLFIPKTFFGLNSRIHQGEEVGRLLSEKYNVPVEIFSSLSDLRKRVRRRRA